MGVRAVLAGARLSSPLLRVPVRLGSPPAFHVNGNNCLTVRSLAGPCPILRWPVSRHSFRCANSTADSLVSGATAALLAGSSSLASWKTKNKTRVRAARRSQFPTGTAADVVAWSIELDDATVVLIRPDQTYLIARVRYREPGQLCFLQFLPLFSLTGLYKELASLGRGFVTFFDHLFFIQSVLHVYTCWFEKKEYSILLRRGYPVAYMNRHSATLTWLSRNSTLHFLSTWGSLL
jgi:hypothetical protein